MVSLHAQQVTFDRIQHPEKEPQNWLSYSQNLFNQRFSPLTQITPANAKNLELQWVWQSKSLEKFEATAHRRRRRALHAAGAAGAGRLRSGRARRRQRPPVLDAGIQAAARSAPVLRTRQPRPRDSRRHALHGHD